MEDEEILTQKTEERKSDNSEGNAKSDKTHKTIRPSDAHIDLDVFGNEIEEIEEEGILPQKNVHEEPEPKPNLPEQSTQIEPENNHKKRYPYSNWKGFYAHHGRDVYKKSEGNFITNEAFTGLEKIEGFDIIEENIKLKKKVLKKLRKTLIKEFSGITSKKTTGRLLVARFPETMLYYFDNLQTRYTNLYIRDRLAFKYRQIHLKLKKDIAKKTINDKKLEKLIKKNGSRPETPEITRHQAINSRLEKNITQFKKEKGFIELELTKDKYLLESQKKYKIQWGTNGKKLPKGNKYFNKLTKIYKNLNKIKYFDEIKPLGTTENTYKYQKRIFVVVNYMKKIKEIEGLKNQLTAEQEKYRELNSSVTNTVQFGNDIDLNNPVLKDKLKQQYIAKDKYIVPKRKEIEELLNIKDPLSDRDKLVVLTSQYKLINYILDLEIKQGQRNSIQTLETNPLTETPKTADELKQSFQTLNLRKATDELAFLSKKLGFESIPNEMNEDVKNNFKIVNDIIDALEDTTLKNELSSKTENIETSLTTLTETKLNEEQELWLKQDILIQQYELVNTILKADKRITKDAIQNYNYSNILEEKFKLLKPYLSEAENTLLSQKLDDIKNPNSESLRDLQYTFNETLEASLNKLRISNQDVANVVINSSPTNNTITNSFSIKIQGLEEKFNNIKDNTNIPEETITTLSEILKNLKETANSKTIDPTSELKLPRLLGNFEIELAKVTNSNNVEFKPELTEVTNTIIPPAREIKPKKKRNLLNRLLFKRKKLEKLEKLKERYLFNNDHDQVNDQLLIKNFNALKERFNNDDLYTKSELPLIEEVATFLETDPDSSKLKSTIDKEIYLYEKINLITKYNQRLDLYTKKAIVDETARPILENELKLLKEELEEETLTDETLTEKEKTYRKEIIDNYEKIQGKYTEIINFFEKYSFDTPGPLFNGSKLLKEMIDAFNIFSINSENIFNKSSLRESVVNLKYTMQAMVKYPDRDLEQLEEQKKKLIPRKNELIQREPKLIQRQNKLIQRKKNERWIYFIAKLKNKKTYEILRKEIEDYNREVKAYKREVENYNIAFLEIFKKDEKQEFINYQIDILNALNMFITLINKEEYITTLTQEKDNALNDALNEEFQNPTTENKTEETEICTPNNNPLKDLLQGRITENKPVTQEAGPTPPPKTPNNAVTELPNTEQVDLNQLAERAPIPPPKTPNKAVTELPNTEQVDLNQLAKRPIPDLPQKRDASKAPNLPLRQNNSSNAKFSL